TLTLDDVERAEGAVDRPPGFGIEAIRLLDQRPRGEQLLVGLPPGRMLEHAREIHAAIPSLDLRPRAVKDDLGARRAQHVPVDLRQAVGNRQALESIQHTRLTLAIPELAGGASVPAALWRDSRTRVTVQRRTAL